mmetsp:Transcript_7916/g.19110  ORF Transcript_7916/g.19110 Transcript_7916/m.19110 type:complete len:318 (-) Transcript_7916:1491-2444(-)
MAAEPGEVGPLSPQGEVSFHTMADGFELHTQTWRVEDPVGVVLYCHGLNEMIDSVIVRRLAHALNAINISLVAYDHDMHGLSMGNYKSCAKCCRSNLNTLTVGRAHAAGMAKVVQEQHPKVPFVLMGHSLGGSTAMSAVELIKQQELEKDIFKGSVLLAPASIPPNVASDTCRMLCCPCLKLTYCLCCWCGIPAIWLGEDNVKKYGLPNSTNHLAPVNLFLPNLCTFFLPEKFGGWPGHTWWKDHNAGVPYTILVGTKDDLFLCKPEVQIMLRDAAPHGTLEQLEGGGHEVFDNFESNWKEWMAKTVEVVLEYVTRE